MDTHLAPAAPRATQVPPRILDKLTSLTPREVEVLELICDGLSDSEIATRCRISGLTVKHHIRNIYSKLGVRRRSHAMVHAITNELVTPRWLAAGWVRRHITT